MLPLTQERKTKYTYISKNFWKKAQEVNKRGCTSGGMEEEEAFKWVNIFTLFWFLDVHVLKSQVEGVEL